MAEELSTLVDMNARAISLRCSHGQKPAGKSFQHQADMSRYIYQTILHTMSRWQAPRHRASHLQR